MKPGAWEIRLRGVVQGVGFRPHVYRLAKEFGICGWVLNSAAGLTVWAEGEERIVMDFFRAMLSRAPRLSRITEQTIEAKPPQGMRNFYIRLSEDEHDGRVLISPDIAVCHDCLRELFDPASRWYRYPLVSCTNCGPRFSIIRDVPYDRPRTSMESFPMCEACHGEYTDPLDRRFHAQTIACPACGPQVSLIDGMGREYEGFGQKQLRQGKILAVKGLGGFHLACDAMNTDAVRALRRRKGREAKPFAVMCRDMDVADRYCRISDREAAALNSPACPIVILERRRDAWLPDTELAPGVATLGVMLPYTPLHHLLFDGGPEILVMTSANRSEAPLITDNGDAMRELADIADYFLLHDREIVNPCDDSVVRIAGESLRLQRRARGYVPLPVPLALDCRPVLACGGDNKNTFCLVAGRQAFFSRHLGDLANYLNYRQFVGEIPRMKRIADIEPEIVAFDLHPDYMSSRYGRESDTPIRVGVQHHQAHLAGCMAENGLAGDMLGVVCDGTGYGTDGAIWGFEFFGGGYRRFERLAQLEYLPLPGGEASIRRPSRVAFAYLYSLMGARGAAAAAKYLTDLTDEEQLLLQQCIDQAIYSPLTSSCGRLFDAAAALLGVCRRVTYEGQAAIELETLSRMEGARPYPVTIRDDNGYYRLAILPVLAGVIEDLNRGVPRETIGGSFHLTVANMIKETLSLLRAKTGMTRVALSGGSFQNQLLFNRLETELQTLGFEVYTHHQVPANDGGIALGQAIIANEVVRHVSGDSGQGYRAYGWK